MAKWWRSMGNPSMFKIDELPYYISIGTINLVSYISCAVMIFHRFCVTREFGYKYLIWWAQYFLFKCKNKILLKKGRINSQSSIIVTSTIGVKQGSWRSETLFGMCMDQFEQMVHKFYGPSWFYGNVVIMVLLYVDDGSNGHGSVQFLCLETKLNWTKPFYIKRKPNQTIYELSSH